MSASRHAGAAAPSRVCASKLTRRLSSRTGRCQRASRRVGTASAGVWCLARRHTVGGRRRGHWAIADPISSIIQSSPARIYRTIDLFTARRPRKNPRRVPSGLRSPAVAAGRRRSLAGQSPGSSVSSAE